MRRTYARLSLDAGVELRDLQDAMGHADPRTTRRFDRNRNNLNKAPGNVLAGWLAGSEPLVRQPRLGVVHERMGENVSRQLE